MGEHILKTTCPKMCQKIIPEIVKNWENRGLEGVLGGLGAFLEPCRAGLAAEAQKCTPEVPKLAQLGGILEVKLGLKSQKKTIGNLWICWLFFEALLEAKMALKRFQNASRNRFQDAFQGAWKRKWWKCDFEQHYNVLATFWGSPRLGNQRKIGKNLTKIASKFKETLEIDFGWILGGFWRPSWRQNRMKIGWKFDWKFWLKKMGKMSRDWRRSSCIRVDWRQRRRLWNLVKSILIKI